MVPERLSKQRTTSEIRAGEPIVYSASQGRFGGAVVVRLAAEEVLNMNEVAVSEEVSAALREDNAVVSLESTIFSNLGLPAPHNEEAYRRCTKVIRGVSVNGRPFLHWVNFLFRKRN